MLQKSNPLYHPDEPMSRVELVPTLLAIVTLVVSTPTISIAQSEQINKADAIAVSLCQLAENPKDFRDKKVSLNARFETTVIEGGMWLEDESCPQYGLELLVAEDVRSHLDNHPDYAALEQAVLRTGNLGTADKTITGRFTGKLVKKHSRGIPLALVYESVDGLSVNLHRNGE